jgi:hypothetical protein
LRRHHAGQFVKCPLQCFAIGKAAERDIPKPAIPPTGSDD